MKKKLELTWLGKENCHKVEARALENPQLFGEKNSDNILIHGDNLLGLKALEQKFTGKIKCVYIDPPYNSGSAFVNYDDNMEHSLWLSLMADRLKIIRTLLKNDGSLWISIDDDEQAYLKVLCDEIFGRNNFVANVIWERVYAPINLKKNFSRSHDSILVYAKNIDKLQLNLLPRTDEMNARYSNPDNDPRGDWQSDNLSVGPIVEYKVYPITTPSGRIVYPPAGYCWRLDENTLKEYIADNRIWFGEDGDNVPRVKRFLSEVKQGVVSKTLWFRDEVGDNQEAKREVKAFNSTNIFDTPKPERLIARILHLATNAGDFVLDSFLGSGTTAAVAHKMGRRWIGIEFEKTCYSHCIPRLTDVITGKDQGGVSKTYKWTGGGGFKLYELPPSLLEKDRHGIEIINPKYNEQMISAAVAKIMGYVYNQDEEHYWKQGEGYENNFVYVTTKFLTVMEVGDIYYDMKDYEKLTIYATAFDDNLREICKKSYSRITIEKIPQVLQDKYDYCIDSYNLPEAYSNG